MTKSEFMRELESLLMDISPEEKTEALQFYDNYFEDAGPGRESEVISELESPAKVAKIIKAELSSNSHEAESRGYFTEKGYEEDILKEPGYELVNSTEAESKGTENSEDEQQIYGTRNDNTYQQHGNGYGRNHTVKGNGSGKLLLIILICIFAIPVGIPVIATVLSLFAAVIATAACFWLAFALMAAAFTISGIILTIAGLIKVVAIPAIGLCLAGGGLLLFGLGLIFIMVTIGLSTKVLPVLFKCFIDFCRLPFRNRRVTA